LHRYSSLLTRTINIYLAGAQCKAPIFRQPDTYAVIQGPLYTDRPTPGRAVSAMHAGQVINLEVEASPIWEHRSARARRWTCSNASAAILNEPN